MRVARLVGAPEGFGPGWKAYREMGAVGAIRLRGLVRGYHTRAKGHGTPKAILSLAYFDLPWHIIAISILLKDQLHKEESAGVDPVKPADNETSTLYGGRARAGLRPGRS